MEKNREAFLGVYDSTNDKTCRAEATWFLHPEKEIWIRQHLILTINNLDELPQGIYENNHVKVFYTNTFFDSKSLNHRLSLMAQIFKGTHSRRTNSDCDDASFPNSKKDKIKYYLNTSYFID